MPQGLTQRFVSVLRFTERYTKTDMVYLASGGFWMAFEQGVSAVFVLALSIAFGHFASQDTYGNYKFVIAASGFLGSLLLTGLSVAVVRSVSQGKEGALRQGARLTLRYAWPFVAASLAAMAYYVYVGNRFAAVGIAIAAVAAPLILAFSRFDSYLVGIKEFARSAWYSIYGNAILLAVMLGALFATHRAIILVATYFAAQAATEAYFYFRTRARTRNTVEEPELLSYGFHLSVMNAVGSAASWFDSVLIFMLLGPAPLAVYLYAIAIPEQLRALVKRVGTLALPRFANRSLSEISRTLWRRLVLLSGAIAVAAGLYMLLAPILFRFLFPVYTASVPFSQWYAPAIILTGITTVLTTVLRAHQRTKPLYVATNAGPIIFIVALLALVPSYGIAGAIASQVIYRIANVIAAVLAFWWSREHGDTVGAPPVRN